MGKGGGLRIWNATLAMAAIGAVCLSLWMYARFGFGLLAEIASDSMLVYVDFEIWWRSAAALLDGENIYRGTGAPASSLNPPLWTMLITPFVLFESLTAYRLFVLVSVATVVGYLAWGADELSLDSKWTALGVATLLFSAPLLSTLILGQVYPFLALSLVAAWVLDRRGNRITAGVALGLIPAMKPLLVPVASLAACAASLGYAQSRFGFGGGSDASRRSRRWACHHAY